MAPQATTAAQPALAVSALLVGPVGDAAISNTPFSPYALYLLSPGCRGGSGAQRTGRYDPRDHPEGEAQPYLYSGLPVRLFSCLIDAISLPELALLSRFQLQDKATILTTERKKVTMMLRQHFCQYP